MSIDYRTGEIVESRALVPIDPTNETSVVALLSQCASWLSTAVERCAPEEIANVKAQMATVFEATKQLDLSKEIKLDAQEMVRRAEYALGKAIRKGQVDGTIRKAGEDTRTDLVGHNTLVSPYAFVGKDEMHGNEAGIAHLAAVDPEQFEEALTAAKAEGNLTRANVVRKVKGKQSPTAHKTRAAKAELLEDLAKQGFSSRQMCKALGLSRDDAVRELAREYGIEIPADKAIVGTRRVNSTQLVENTATALEGLLVGVELVDMGTVDPDVARQWAGSIKNSLRVLNRFARDVEAAGQ